MKNQLSSTKVRAFSIATKFFMLNFVKIAKLFYNIRINNDLKIDFF
jgi:hypothetical protein